MMSYSLSHLKQLEAEAIHIIRETVAQCEKPVLLFSGGKDSICIVRLAQKAFYPARIPFPLFHVDTGHNFPEAIEFRDKLAKDINANLMVGLVQDSIDKGTAIEETGPNASRNALQSVTLMEGFEEHQWDAAFGGARRDEEKARAKERIFSHRNEFGEWDIKNQRPELWNIYNGKKAVGEHFRIFPISNWTEMDVWQYIKQEEIELPSIYFSHKREVFTRDGVLLAKNEFLNLREGEEINEEIIRYRTLGDMTCTGAVRSEASTLDDVIQEVASATVSERGGRADDQRSESAMEDRKAQGYF
ncbi:MAG: sulfate adenylyltransferase subunit CysD [Cyclobacteriaceae bacterium]